MSKNTTISEIINYLTYDGSGNIVFTTVSAAASNTDKFLVSDAGTLKFRTAAQLLSDIGAQASGSYQTLLTNPVTGTGTSGYLTKWSGSSTVNSSAIYQNGSNIGIGLTNAGALIHTQSNVSGVTEIQGRFENLSIAGRAQFILSSGTYPANFFSLMTHGTSIATSYYASVTGANDAGKAILLGQGTSMTEFVIGTYNSAPLGLFTSNTIRLSFAATGAATFTNRINGVVGGTLYNTAGLWLQGSSSTDGIAIGGTGGGDKTIDTYGGTLKINATAGNGLSVTGAAKFSAKVSVKGGSNLGGYYMDYQSDATSRSFRISSEHLVYADFVIQRSTTRTGTTYEDLLYFDANRAATFSSSVTATQFNAVNDRNFLARGSFRLTSPTNNASNLDISVWDNTTNINGNYYSGGNDNTIIIGTYAKYTNQLVLKPSGNIGIGVTDPLATLSTLGGAVQFMGDYSNMQTIIKSAGTAGTLSGNLLITIPQMSNANTDGYGGFSCEVYVAGYSGLYCHAWFSGYINGALVASEATILRSSGGWSISQVAYGANLQGFQFTIDYPASIIHPTARIIFNKGGSPNATAYPANSITAVFS